MRKLLLPEQALAEWVRRYARRHLAWWSGEDAKAPAEGQPAAWPQALALGTPTASEASDDPAQVRSWAQAWQAWPGPGEVLWEERQWPRLGTQRLPVTLVLPAPEAAAHMAGHGVRWRRAVDRRRELARTLQRASLPAETPMPAGSHIFEALADWSDADFERLVSVLQWVVKHPASGLYLRQLPVPGLDSKWIEQRRTVVTDFAKALPHNRTASTRDLHGLLGLARAPTRLRLRVLCANLRRQFGGLSDLEAPLGEIAALTWQPERVLVVENLDSALSLPDLPGTVVFMKLGHAVGLLADIGWLRQAQVRYWGDIDSHGLAILNQARLTVPQVQSMLMDRETLLAHRTLWVQEPRPWTGAALAHLTDAERALFEDLAANTWGVQVRLEQERIPWAVVLDALGVSGPATQQRAAPAPTGAGMPGATPPDDRATASADTEPRQLDIFADSGDIVLRNAFADAVLAENRETARRALNEWRSGWPDDALLAPAERLMAHLQASADAIALRALPAAEVLAAASTLEGEIGPAAAALLGDAAAAWMAQRWSVLAEQARNVAWHPAQAQAQARRHAAALFLRAGQWRSAAEAAACIDSWRRIPQPLLWMAEARWRGEGADAAWPLLAEAFWLSPARAHALLETLADRRLHQAMQRFEDQFDLLDDEDWTWWPAWLAVDQPLLAQVLGLAEDVPDRPAAAGFRLVASLLRLEREGRHHDIVAARKRLQSLEPRLFASYMRTR